MSIRIFKHQLIIFLALLIGPLWAPQAAGQTSADAFDGSFRLGTGEVITGGYFVEDGKDHFLYMDTEHLSRGGLFERTSDTVLRSIVPEDIRIEFVPSANGALKTLIWSEKGHEPIRGERVYPHRSRPIHFTSGDGTKLQGRLLSPECPGPHPVVVSVHGSGPVNRYGGPYHTFFLKHGIAVLAYDKRGYTTDKEAWREPDLADLAADAAAAVRFAAAQSDLDADRLGIFGSSQAGWVVPRAAVEAPETDFIILRAGAVVSELETVLHEIRQELRLKGMDGLDLDYAMDLRREIYQAAMRGEPISATDSLVTPYMDEQWYQAAFGDGPVSNRWSTHWWGWAQRNLAVAATPYLARFEGPALWFLAGLDENVPLIPTRAALERAFAASPSDDHEIIVLDGALHSFVMSNPNGPPRFSSGFFDHMRRWMEDRDFSKTKCWER